MVQRKRQKNVLQLLLKAKSVITGPALNLFFSLFTHTLWEVKKDTYKKYIKNR